ncbi:hypothetical protein NKH77_25550 [Streptomyces sp. M19]
MYDADGSRAEGSGRTIWTNSEGGAGPWRAIPRPSRSGPPRSTSAPTTAPRCCRRPMAARCWRSRRTTTGDVPVVLRHEHRRPLVTPPTPRDAVTP